MLSSLQLTSFLVLLSSNLIAATKSTGCGTTLPTNSTPGGASQQFSITSGGIERTYKLYIPSSYKSSTAAPLILSYHGNTRTADDQERISEFSLEKCNTEFVVVYPNGVDNSWQGASYSAAGVDDVSFTSDLLDHLESTLCIDTDRLYASGKSNGGGFVGLLTCDSAMSLRITAFAAVSGAFYPGTRIPCNPTTERTHVPIIDFHGMNDTTIPYYGGAGKGGALPSIRSWLEDKASRDGCSKTPDTREILRDGLVWKDVWTCGDTDGKRVLVAYNETDLAHKWPGTEQTGDDLVIATPRILEFFREWS
ncbi:putative ferulic acid esterase [Morchella snyderi]|nr:putative ferulic acid esterase [Morchella snyderi]